MASIGAQDEDGNFANGVSKHARVFIPRGYLGFGCPYFFVIFLVCYLFDIFNGNTNHKDSWTLRTGSTEWLYFRGVSISFQICALELEAALLERRQKVVPHKWSEVVPRRCAL